MLKQKLNLLIIAKNIDGGTGTFTINLLKIKKLFNNSKITILSLEKPGYRKVENQNFFYLRKSGYYPQKYKLNSLNIFSFFEEISLCRKAIKKITPDIIYGLDFHTNLLAILNKIIFYKKIKIISGIHINLPDTLLNKSSSVFLSFILKTLVKLLYPYSDKIICVSKNLKENFVKNFNIKKNIEVIYNGYPLNSTAHFLPKNQKYILISIGRFVEQKNFETLILAFKQILIKYPNSKLFLVGDGPLKNDFEKMIKDLNLNKKVILTGWKTNIISFLKKAHLFILSSKREGFPYSLIEAMSYGLPVVSTDSPFGPREITDNGKYGKLVPIGNSKTMSKAILELLSNKKVYQEYSRKSFLRSKYFSLDKMLKNYQKLINSL